MDAAGLIVLADFGGSVERDKNATGPHYRKQ